MDDLTIAAHIRFPCLLRSDRERATPQLVTFDASAACTVRSIDDEWRAGVASDPQISAGAMTCIDPSE